MSDDVRAALWLMALTTTLAATLAVCAWLANTGTLAVDVAAPVACLALWGLWELAGHLGGEFFDSLLP